MPRCRSTSVAYLLAFGLLLAWPRPAPADVINFADLPLAPNPFNNNSGGFVSGGAFFNNTFTDFGGGLTAWSGWSYSNLRDVTTQGYGNQYSAYNLPSGGGDGSPNYAVAYAFNPGDAIIHLPPGTNPVSVDITNTTYAALSMLYGDQFAKKFGGPTGTDPDFFRLTITGLDDAGATTGSVDLFLADFRSGEAGQGFIVSSWTPVDLTPLGDATNLSFALTSSDVGPFGTNTPAYFALGNLQVVDPPDTPEPGTLALLGLGVILLWAGRRWRRTDCPA
jgi:hypothetical protein